MVPNEGRHMQGVAGVKRGTCMIEWCYGSIEGVEKVEERVAAGMIELIHTQGVGLTRALQSVKLINLEWRSSRIRPRRLSEEWARAVKPVLNQAQKSLLSQSPPSADVSLILDLQEDFHITKLLKEANVATSKVT
ncbi:hypothetical protein ACSQ67_019704 [Phaseolus vulgaris]